MGERSPAGRFRHPDHRFEWTRHEFPDWAQGVADRFGYDVEMAGIGPIDADHGQPSQVAVFSRLQTSKADAQAAEPLTA